MKITYEYHLEIMTDLQTLNCQKATEKEDFYLFSI